MSPVNRPQVVPGARADERVDTRVAAVLQVLGGSPPAEVARRSAVDPALLHRWVRDFVEAGTAQVTNTPVEGTAQQRDRFLAAFAHEVRTPLAVAQGWVSMLMDGDLPPEAVESTAARLHAALTRLAERTLDVELLAAASLGRLRLSPQPVAVGELVTALPGLDGVSGEGPAVQVTVDPQLFPRVLRDLWEAGSARPTPRSMRLEVLTRAPWVELRVVRDADPIDPVVLQALFEPFDLNDDDTGVTIGLYLARALTVAHGGTVGVDQDEAGAVLWVRVPLGDSETTRARVVDGAQGDS
jgi:signal transduction histidine kinase